MSNQDITTRVAKAIYEGRNGPGCKPWAHLTKEHQKPYLRDAQASGNVWAEVAARFNRLQSVCGRILWEDMGKPAVNNPQTQAALNDLSEILFMNGIDQALAGEAPSQTDRAEGEIDG